VIRSDRGSLTIQDLGTPNGTRVNGVVLSGATHRLAPGDVVVVGPAELLVAFTASAPDRHVLLGSGRLERELASAASTMGRLALVRIATAVDAAGDPSELLGEALATEALGPTEIAALMHPAAAEALCERLARDTRDHRPRATVAYHPEHGTTIRALWDRARASADEAPVEAPEGIVVADPAMVKVFRLAKRLAATSTTVLVVGETGSGKEVVAEQVHGASARRAGPFIRLNCGALPEALLESELFGHEKGAFTGASQRKIGYFEAAADGTLLLDEIGELGPALQSKLLRVLERRVIVRLGSTAEISIRARLVFATHRDLKADVARGRFRQDLYYRVSTFTLRVPPLRERPAEILLLAERFARGFAEAMGVPPPTLDRSARAALSAHAWPGNVRELRNAIEHALVVCDGGVVTAADLPEELGGRPAGRPPSHAAAGPMRSQIDELERRTIEEALAAENGNRTYAARRLGVSRRALLYKLSKYGLSAR
jgi:DNA-binding NtrC family response regulator